MPPHWCINDLGHLLCAQNTGTSLLEAFSAEQIRAHLTLIRQMSEQQRALQVQPLLPTDVCKVCQLTKLSFEPPVIYCSLCGLKIKRAQVYYSTPADASNDLKVGGGARKVGKAVGGLQERWH